MSTGLQLALFFGAMLGAGVALIVSRLLPAQPDLADALQRLDPDRSSADVETTAAASQGLQERLGMLLWTRGHPRLLGAVSHQDLAILRKTPAQHLGEKAMVALVGLSMPVSLSFALASLGVRLPITVPVAFSLGLAAILFWTPDARVRTDAKKAREDFVRDISAYIDAVAMQRINGAGTTAALVGPARMGDTWIFRRLREELDRAEWSGQPPWEALTSLSKELAIPELADTAEIMRLSRDEGASVYEQLRARSSTIRSTLLNKDLAEANATTQRIAFPVVLLAFTFAAAVTAPSVMRILG